MKITNLQGLVVTGKTSSYGFVKDETVLYHRGCFTFSWKATEIDAKQQTLTVQGMGLTKFVSRDEAKSPGGVYLCFSRSAVRSV